MALTKTLATLRTECRERADVQSNYVGDDELDRLINSSMCELYDMLVNASRDWFLSSSTISVVSGTEAYSLPSDFYRAEGVDVLGDSGNWRPLRRFRFSDRNRNQDNASKDYASYRIMGGNLRISPEPSWSGSVRVWYIPAPVLLAGPSDTFDGVAGWEDFIVVDVCLKLANKQEEDPTPWLAQRKAIMKRISEMASSRDDGEPDQIRDVDAELSGTILACEC